jgi:hypothetical protein
VKNARKTAKKVKRHRACASEFDYSGWKTWARWRRSGVSKRIVCEGGNVRKKDCWNTCDYPSECRWGRKFGIHTPLTPSPPQTSPPLKEHPEEGLLNPENYAKKSDQSDSPGKPDFWTTLIASAERRKSVTGSSPLTAEVSSSNTPQSLLIDSDGKVEMSPSPTSPSLTSPSVGSVARDMLKDLMKRRTSLKGWKSDRQCPMLTVPKTVSLKEVEDGDGGPEAILGVDMDDGLEGLERLERVGSRREWI